MADPHAPEPVGYIYMEMCRVFLIKIRPAEFPPDQAAQRIKRKAPRARLKQ